MYFSFCILVLCSVSSVTSNNVHEYNVHPISDESHNLTKRSNGTVTTFLSNTYFNDKKRNETVEELLFPEDYAPEITNDTLKKHNVANRTEDKHVYYKSWNSSDIEIGQHYWIDLDRENGTITHQMLSQSLHRAIIVPLPFKFLFYGHEIDNVTITTGGFLYTGDYIHSWLMVTQYIAPLMANFDFTLSNDSYVKYFSNSTTFTVLWENVALKELPNAGNFTFEVTLCWNGDIIFVYRNIPNITFETSEENHPVKVGLSDAYIIDEAYFFTRRKTILEYHRVHFDKKDLKNWTVIYLTPLQTCNNKTTCESCLAKNTDFNCQWCDGRCSNGFDRRRQDWIKKDCDKRKTNDTKFCHITPTDGIPTAGAQRTATAQIPSEKSNSRNLGLLFLLAVISISVVVVVWSLYAYRNPYSTSGQILIRYRPSQWSTWRKGEARYTAATIHM